MASAAAAIIRGSCGGVSPPRQEVPSMTFSASTPGSAGRAPRSRRPSSRSLPPPPSPRPRRPAVVGCRPEARPRRREEGRRDGPEGGGRPRDLHPEERGEGRPPRHRREALLRLHGPRVRQDDQAGRRGQDRPERRHEDLPGPDLQVGAHPDGRPREAAGHGLRHGEREAVRRDPARSASSASRRSPARPRRRRSSSPPTRPTSSRRRSSRRTATSRRRSPRPPTPRRSPARAPTSGRSRSRRPPTPPRGFSAAT